MENHTIVTLKKGEGRTIKAGGAWIFDNEIDTITGTFTNGDIVVVHDSTISDGARLHKPEFKNPYQNDDKKSRPAD